MFREMRRFKNAMPKEDAIKILEKGSNGILSVCGDEGYPYGVPVSYTYLNNKIYFHGANTGHKLDAIKNNPKVSFTVVEKDDVKPSEFTTRFASTIVFGQAHIANEEEKAEGLEVIMLKYSKDFEKEGRDYIKSDYSKTTVVVIEIDYISGKKN